MKPYPTLKSTLAALGALSLVGCIITTGDDDDTGGSPTVTAGTGGPGQETEGESEGVDETGDETGDEADPFERPDRAREIISDEDLQRLVDEGAVVYPGSDPPDVAGVFDVLGGVVAYHDREWIEGTDLCYMIWTLESTDDPEQYVSSSEMYNNCTGSGEGSSTYISGSGDCFTLYSAGSGERDGCEFEDAGITSGCLTDDGIAEMVGGLISGSWESVQEDACESLIDAGLHGDEGELAVLDYHQVIRVE